MNRMIKCAVCLLMVVSFFACTKPTLRVKGKIENVKEASLFFWVFEDGGFVRKKEIKVVDGAFAFTYEVDGAEVGYITSVDEFKYGKVIFLEDKELTIDGLIFRDLFRVKALAGEGLNAQYFAFEQERVNLMREGKKGLAYAKEKELKEKFIAANASNILGLYELFELSKHPDNYKKVSQLYASLPKPATDYKLYATIGQNIKALDAITPGNRAVDFNFTTLNGEEISLDYFQGKVLMIDFWASWCGPCVKELPHVKELYEKYNDKGFEVLGVSLDSKEKSWLTAIEKFNLNWHNYSALNKWDCDFAKKYFVRGIPYNVIIDQNGNIVAKGIHGKQLESTIEQLLN
ncbi:redoxin domain-containing protein [Carboxylicivirga taeanensis]|uniref:redoxin domain-containing protein n=1 Tax=Carboxylicivirga taeanensis TaxID=1416875 RepID=UPI003F6DB8C6